MEEGILHKGTRHRAIHSHPTEAILPTEGTLQQATLPPADTLLLTVAILRTEDMVVTLLLVILVTPVIPGMVAEWEDC
ncbi:unnamed protein product [Linum tenue]|uniref:Uncharacterized protein n=1 Tax=Linum tenue TaxID=586396 RepID=A0AAV0MZA0_9ROSI|nr:unnamed protein product [Linum tenue]